MINNRILFIEYLRRTQVELSHIRVAIQYLHYNNIQTFT